MLLLVGSLLQRSLSDAAVSLLSVFCSVRPSGEDRPSVAGQIHLAEIDDPLLHHNGPVQEGKAGRQTWGFVSACIM